LAWSSADKGERGYAFRGGTFLVRESRSSSQHAWRLKRGRIKGPPPADGPGQHCVCVCPTPRYLCLSRLPLPSANLIKQISRPDPGNLSHPPKAPSALPPQKGDGRRKTTTPCWCWSRTPAEAEIAGTWIYAGLSLSLPLALAEVHAGEEGDEDDDDDVRARNLIFGAVG